MDKIIFATDFSAAARRALDYSVILAREAQATLIVAHALKPRSSLFSSSEEDRRGRRGEHQRRLDAFAGAIDDDALAVETRLVEGAPADALQRLASDEDADLLVIAKRSRTTLERFFVGSVTILVASQVPCPVLITPDGVDDRFDQNILCPVDFSANSRSALSEAIQIADVFERDLTVLYVAQPDQGEERMQEWKEKLEEMARACGAPSGADLRVVRAKRPADAIVEVAEESASDMVIVGRRGRSGGDYVGLGATANAVLKAETFPLLIVPISRS